MNCSQCSIYKNVALNVPCDCRVCQITSIVSGSARNSPCHSIFSDKWDLERFQTFKVTFQATECYISTLYSSRDIGTNFPKFLIDYVLSRHARPL